MMQSTTGNSQFTIHNSQGVLLSSVQTEMSVRFLLVRTKLREPFDNCELYIVN